MSSFGGKLGYSADSVLNRAIIKSVNRYKPYGTWMRRTAIDKTTESHRRTVVDVIFVNRKSQHLAVTFCCIAAMCPDNNASRSCGHRYRPVSTSISSCTYSPLRNEQVAGWCIKAESPGLRQPYDRFRHKGRRGIDDKWIVRRGSRNCRHHNQPNHHIPVNIDAQNLA